MSLIEEEMHKILKNKIESTSENSEKNLIPEKYILVFNKIM